MSAAFDGGRPPPEENLSTKFADSSPVGLDRPAALRLAYRVDLEILVPEIPSGELPEVGKQSIEVIGSTLEGITGFEELLPSREERAETKRQRRAEEEVEIAENRRAVIQAIVALDWEYVRNPPSVPDTLEVTIPSRMMPFDLRVAESVRIQGWTFVRNAASESFDDRLDRCMPGDPGHFAGVVDNIEVNRTNGTAIFTCRDLTSIPLSRQLTPKIVKSLDMRQSAEELVADIMAKGVPGGDQWKVEPRGKLRVGARSPATLLADEKRKKVTRQVVEQVSHTAVEGVVIAEIDPNATTDDFNGQIEGMVLYSERTTDKGDFEARRDVLPYQPWFANETEFEVRNVSRYVTVRTPPKPETVLGAEQQTVWDGIVRLCAKLSVIPEVTLAEDGAPLIVLVDAEDYLDGRSFRVFRRGDRNHRILTYGRDIAELAESLDLTAGDKVDWVEVYAIDPDTGETRRERYGKVGRKGAGSGQLIPAHGIVDRNHLQRLARQIWSNLNKAQLQVGVEVDVPWTTGGGVDDPDLLQCAAGTLIELAFASAPRYRGRSLEDILRGPPIYLPAQPAKVLARASERAEPSLVFQVAELVHSGSGEGTGSYRCSLTLQTLLDDGVNPERLEVDDT